LPTLVILTQTARMTALGRDPAGVVMVEPHPLLRYGWRRALESQTRLAWRGEFSTGTEAISRVAELRPDLVVMEMHLPDLPGPTVIRQILAGAPGAKILIFSGDGAPPLVDAALQAGASGYVLKQSPLEELGRAAEWVLAGRPFLSPELGSSLVEQHQKSLTGATGSPPPGLTEREKNLLRLVAGGLRNKEIAAELKLRVNSIETYRVRLMKKTGCASTAQLVLYAIRSGYIPCPRMSDETLTCPAGTQGGCTRPAA